MCERPSFISYKPEVHDEFFDFALKMAREAIKMHELSEEDT